MLAVLIVVRFGLHPEPIRSSIGQISDKLLQHANTTSAEPGTVIQTGDTIFLRKMQSLITKTPFVAGLLLFSLGMICIQCGLMFFTLMSTGTVDLATIPTGYRNHYAPADLTVEQLFEQFRD